MQNVKIVIVLINFKYNGAFQTETDDNILRDKVMDQNVEKKK